MPREICAILALCLLCQLGMLGLAGPLGAVPRLQPGPYPSTVGQLFYEPEAYAPFKAGQPLLRRRGGRQPLIEGETGFADKQVVVDSTGAHFRPRTAGFDDGLPVTLSRHSYIDLGMQHNYTYAWRGVVRRSFRTQAAQQQSRGRGGRLEWRVPIPGPRVARRLIGEEGSLRINGSHTATIGGKSQWTAGEVRTLAGSPSKFPTLNMEQESKFSVEGSVGEAINIRITQDTQSLGSSLSQNLQDQLANQIKLDYKGDEDDIFQEVQAGNTTLSLPNTRFVGFSQQHKGLFGIRAKGHLGDLQFTTIASHEKSESNRQTFRGGAQVDTTEIHDYEYVRNQWFFLDHRYRTRLSDFAELSAGIPADLVPGDAIDAASLQVFINDFNVNNDAEQLARPGVAYADLDARLKEVGHTEVGTWHRLDPDNDYGLVQELGYVVLRVAVQERHAMAVVYRTRSGETVGRVPASPDSLVLKLIKPRDARPGFPTWDLEWKNVYRIVRGFSRGRLFDEDKIRVEVLREVAGKEPENTQNRRSFLQLMGLDTHGQDQGTSPDQIVDADYVGLDGAQGVLIFPDLRPFDPQHTKYDVLDTKVPEIYDQQQRRDQIEASRYIIQVINSSAQQRINLSQGRLASIDVESVDVRLNGKSLTRGRDYNVTFTGEVQFMGETADLVGDPGADLEITYESQDLIGLGNQQKTLLGVRSEYEFLGGDGVVGGTLIYNNVRSAEKRVRVGAEPARTVVWDLDVKARFEAPLLTRAVDALPLLKTAAPSDVTLQAEIAQSRPNLNTKGKGYIDDFEGSERPEILSVFRSRWTKSSVPVDFSTAERGRTTWYNPYNRVERTSIWPGQRDQIEANNNKTDVLAIEVARRTPDAIDPWGGIMTVFTGGVRDFSQSKFVDIWLRTDADTRGELHLDLGDISEDWITNGDIDTEDEPLPGRTTGDGQVSKEEDIGIDGRTDEEERDQLLVEAGIDTTGLSVDERWQRYDGEFGPGRRSDPAGDNWDYDPSRNRDDYRFINGTQGNRLAEGGQRPDTEDLNNDGNLSTRNDYYHHVIDLASNDHVEGTCSDVEVGGRCNAWRMFRLRLYGDTVEHVGTPDSSRIEFARISLVNTDMLADSIRVQIAQIEIVGNEWQENAVARHDSSSELVAADELLNVTVIGTDENQSYKPPPGVKGQRLSSSRVREREQSLVLDYTSLAAGHEASATKVLTSNANYTKYTRLRMFVHGDSSLVDPTDSDLELYLRFGADSLNYYEYSTRVYLGWDERNEVEMDLRKMSQLKAELQRGRFDTTGMRLTQLDTVVADPRYRGGAPAIYRVRGNPSMQQIRQLSLGLRNLGTEPFTGRVFADELRLDEARNDAGIAAFMRLNTQLADFMDLDVNLDWQSEDFRTINNTERKSSDLTSSVSSTAHLHKLLPGSWGFTVPVKVSYGRNLSLPRFGPNSDVELNATDKDSLRTESTKEFVEVSISKRAGQSLVTRWTLDQMNLRLSQTRNRKRSPVTPMDDQDARTVSFSYKMPLPTPRLAYLSWLPEYMPKSLRESQLTPVPRSLNYGLNVNQQETASWRATQRDTTFNETFSMKETYATKFNPLRSLSADYSLQVDRDLRKKYDPSRLAFGREVRRNQKADVKLQLRLVRWLDPTLTFQANYDENSDPRRSRQAVALDTLGDGPPRVVPTIDVTTKNTLSARVNVRLPDVLKAVGAAPRRQRRAPRVPTRRDSSAVADDGDRERPEKAQDTGPFFLRRYLYSSASFVEPLSYSWRRTTDAKDFNLVARPRLVYQLGLDDSLLVDDFSIGLTQQDTWSRGTNTDVSSGLRLPLGFQVKPSYKEQVSRRSGSSENRLRVERSRTFPSVTVNWGRADRIPGLRRFFNSAQVNMRLEETESQQAEGSLDPSRLIREGISREWSATWTGQWRIGPTTRFEVRRSSSEDLDYDLADSTLALSHKPPLRGAGVTERNTTTFETRYKLRPTKLPLFGKLRSNVDLKFVLSLNSQSRESATGEEELAPISASERWEARIDATYSFSENFRGRGVIRIENDSDKITDKTRKVREVNMSGTLFFR